MSGAASLPQQRRKLREWERGLGLAISAILMCVAALLAFSAEPSPGDESSDDALSSHRASMSAPQESSPEDAAEPQPSQREKNQRMIEARWAELHAQSQAVLLEFERVAANARMGLALLGEQARERARIAEEQLAAVQVAGDDVWQHANAEAERAMADLQATLQNAQRQLQEHSLHDVQSPRLSKGADGWFLSLTIGLVAGWLASLIVKGRGFGIVGDIIVGIVGAVFGGWLFRVMGVIPSGVVGALLMALVGSAAFLSLIRVIKRT